MSERSPRAMAMALAVSGVAACGFPRLMDVPIPDDGGSSDTGSSSDASSTVDASPAVDASPTADAPTDAPPLGLDRQRVIYDGLVDQGGFTTYQAFSVRLNGTDSKQITREPAVGDGSNGPTGARFSAVSPDGKYLVSVAGDLGPRSLVVVNIDGTGRRTLVAANNASEPAFSGDGQRVAFVSNGDIHVASFGRGDSDPVVCITCNVPHPGHAYDHPSWGGSGKVAFVDVADNEINLVNADGTNLVNLTNHPARDSNSVFSRDGSKIAYTSNRSGANEVWTMNADGGAPQRLTTRGVSYPMSFDVEGRHVLYMTDDFSIRMIALDGTGDQPLPGVGGIGGGAYAE